MCFCILRCFGGVQDRHVFGSCPGGKCSKARRRLHEVVFPVVAVEACFVLCFFSAYLFWWRLQGLLAELGVLLYSCESNLPCFLADTDGMCVSYTCDFFYLLLLSYAGAGPMRRGCCWARRSTRRFRTTTTSSTTRRTSSCT